MKILVCVKQIPDLERIVVHNGADGMAALDAFDTFRMNRFDEFAVEEAVCIKETIDAVHIDVITVGPERVADVLKRAIGMGADEGIHLQTPADADPGPATVAAWIAEYARPKGYKLILCGSMSEDGMHGQVGPMVATHLNLPYATQVIAIQPVENPSRISIEREIEGGAREMLDMEMPAVLALQPGINRPRYPSLSKLLRANKQTPETISTDTLTPSETRIDCLGIVLPTPMRGSHILTGSAREKADQLVAMLKERAFL
ncbi:MAG: electron transfer flavoprotein subunit beta/FixA family protein [Deltaproteobacteria bacterium]|nr:electron transfer flavoprotein subunit beta/FixA family protein [Deltaproteobacteria bacterium]